MTNRALGTGCDMDQDLNEIIANFELMDDWDDRYRYLIELGRTLAPMAETAHTEENRVRGCASQVWLLTSAEGGPGPDTRVHFAGDSDAHIVRGLVALTLAVYSGKRAGDILTTDAGAVFEKLGLSAHLTPQRSNGVRSMVERIKADARRLSA
jgi:cysteine desulfuration protein SufE